MTLEQFKIGPRTIKLEISPHAFVKPHLS